MGENVNSVRNDSGVPLAWLCSEFDMPIVTMVKGDLSFSCHNKGAYQEAISDGWIRVWSLPDLLGRAKVYEAWCWWYGYGMD